MSLRKKIIDIVICATLVSYMKPMNVTLITPLDNIYNGLKILSTIAILLMVIKRGVHFSKGQLFCLLLVSVWTISIYQNQGSLDVYLQEILSIIGLLFLFGVINNKPQKTIYILGVLSSISKVYILLQFITIITKKPLFADPIVSFDRYFLGSDNYSAFILIPLCSFIFMNCYLRFNRIKIEEWLFPILGFLCLAIPFSVSGMLSYGLMLILMLFMNYPDIRKWFTPKKIIAFIIVFLFLVIAFNIQDKFVGIIGLFGKRGLSSREIIWPRTVDAIMKKPLIGWGALTDAQINSYLLYGAGHAHNIMLEFLLDVGVLGSFFSFLWIYYSFRGMKKIKTKTIHVMQICMSCYLLCSIFDFYFGLIYFWLLIFVAEATVAYYKQIDRWK